MELCCSQSCFPFRSLSLSLFCFCDAFKDSSLFWNNVWVLITSYFHLIRKIQLLTWIYTCSQFICYKQWAHSTVFSESHICTLWESLWSSNFEHVCINYLKLCFYQEAICITIQFWGNLTMAALWDTLFQGMLLYINKCTYFFLILYELNLYILVLLASYILVPEFRYNIRVNAVLPGFIETPMSAKVPENVMQIILALIPLKRMGKPEGFWLLFVTVIHNLSVI